MLAGRGLQGVGSGVILSLVEIVLADLVSLSERLVDVFNFDARGLNCVFAGAISKEPLVQFGLWLPPLVH